MVFVLHGTYIPAGSQFVLWAEQGEQPQRKHGRQAKLAAHPFCASSVQILDRLSAVAPSIHAVSANHTVWLPSYDKLPQPSPELLATGAIPVSEAESLSLKAWKVDSVELSVMDAVDLLLALGERDSALMTADIRFWRHLTLYALSL